MTIKAVAFDIGGVLEITPPLGVTQRWEERLGLERGEIEARLDGLFEAGAVGAITEAEYQRQVRENLGLDQSQLDLLMADLWEEYLGTWNDDLARFFGGLRPAYRTGIISNSFVGAREREQARYRMQELTDVIIYSHEVGVAKPQEMIFLDDVAANVAAARDLGIHAILFSSTAQAIADIQAGLES